VNIMARVAQGPRGPAPGAAESGALASPTLRSIMLWCTVVAAIGSGCTKDPTGEPQTTSSVPPPAALPSAQPVATETNVEWDARQFVSSIRKQFGKEHSCPEERVTAKLRPEIDVMQFHPRKVKSPSAEGKADPERYAKWKADDQKDEKWHRDYYFGNHVYEVSGCNINELQDCGWLRGSRGGPIPWAAACKVVTLPTKKK